MKINDELLKSAFAEIEEERKASFDETLETLMSGGILPEEERALKKRLEENEEERTELQEMIRVGVFEGTPFENSRLSQEIQNMPSTTKTNALYARKSREVPWLVAAASILALCVVGVEYSGRVERAQELRLARVDLENALKEGGFERTKNETALVWHGYDLRGESFVAKSFSSFSNVVDNEETRRVDDAFDAVMERDGSDEIRLDRALFVLREERDPKRAKDVLNAIRSESPRKRALLGVVEFMEGEPEKALEYFRRARKEDDRPEYALNEAVCLTYLGKFEDAKPIFENVLERIDDERIKRDIQDLIDER